MKHIDFYLDAIQKKNAGGGGTGGITPTGTKEISIVANGERTEDVTQYANAHIVVDVPVPDEPTGVTQITQNGIHDVKNFASANVQVPVPAEPAGSKVIEITANGNTKHDVKQFAEADVRVNVPSEGITPTGVKTITANGTHDVTEFAQAKVEVPVGVNPTGTKDITENGVHDIKAFANVNVQVPVGVNPSGTKTIDIVENGSVTENIREFENVTVNVNVPTGGGNEARVQSLVSVLAGTVTEQEFTNADVTALNGYNFFNNTVTRVYSLPNAKSVGQYVFACDDMNLTNSKVSEIHLKSSRSIGKGCFENCMRLATLEIPNVQTIAGPDTFSRCQSLEKLVAPKLSSYALTAFKNKYKPPIQVLDILGGDTQLDISELSTLKTLIIRRTDKVSPLYGTTWAQNIYVADNLVEQYKTATNWSKHADKIKPISEYVEV